MGLHIKFSRSDFIAIVGFFGHTALVNTKLKKQVARLSVIQLLEAGFYKEAVYSAFLDDTHQSTILDYFNALQGVRDFESLKREYGIDDTIVNKIKKIKRL